MLHTRKCLAVLALGAGLGSGFPTQAKAAPPAAAAVGAGQNANANTNANPAPLPPLARINKLIADGKLAEAADAMRAEYAKTADAMLLLREARLRLRLGDKAAALVGFRQFLAEAKTPHPALKSEAEAAIHELDPPPPQLPPPPMVTMAAPQQSPSLASDLRLVPAPEPLADSAADPRAELVPDPKKNRKLLITGGVLLAAGYLPALVMPMVFSAFLGQEGAPSPEANYTLLIPVAGPLISGITAPVQLIRQGERGGPLLSSWSLPWIATSGLVQATGLAVLIVAGKRQAALRRQQTSPAPSAPRVLVAPFAQPNEAGLVFSGRF